MRIFVAAVVSLLLAAPVACAPAYDSMVTDDIQEQPRASRGSALEAGSPPAARAEAGAPEVLAPARVSVALADGEDCQTVKCPAEAPFPVACDVVFEGGDARGCVAAAARATEVFFKEGSSCGSGTVHGWVQCSAVQGQLDAASCVAHGKSELLRVSAPSACPQ